LRDAVPAIDDGAMAGTSVSPDVFPDCVPTLVDGEVTLRAHRLSDVDAMLEQCVDPLTIRWTTVPVPFSRDDAVSYATRAVPAGWADGTELGFAMEAPHTDGVRRFCGSVSLRMHGDGVAEIAYGLHPDARGRSVCRRAVKLIVDWGFETQGLEVVTWYAEVGNWASRRVAWSSGFSFDGMVRGLLLQRGERKDGWIGSLRATDDRRPKNPWNISPELTTERLRLRPLTAADADRFGEMVFDDRSRHFGGRVRSVRELKTGAEALHRAWEACARGERYEWAIADRETDVIVGHIQLFDLTGLDDTEAKPGYQVHEDSRGRGYVTEALTAVTEWAFSPTADGGLGKRRISLTTAATNKASRHAAESAGYTHVGTEPDAFPVGDTDFDDLAIYHRINPNWQL
jgi:[ribosomal protein S5]-alanine N-acetyltransferase